MRKQKFENEMKEVQSKPKISSRSRKLAVRAEKKQENVIEIEEKPVQKIKHICDDEIIELEEDIQLLEACLNMNKAKIVENDNSLKINDPSLYHFFTVDQISHKNSEKNCKMLKNNKVYKTNKNPNTTSIKSRILTESPIKLVNNTPQRKFIKRALIKPVKQRSSSMGNLIGTHFSYRSLSPFQVPIKRS